MFGARSTATGSAPPAPSLFPPIHIAQVVGHLLDLVLRPERAAADHAVERALPGAAVLALVHPHVGAVALEALRYQHVLARPVGETGRRGFLLLRRRRLRGERRAEDCRPNFRHRLYVAQCPARTCAGSPPVSPSCPPPAPLPIHGSTLRATT